MSWYSGGTNNTGADEISLHCAGHANNGRHLYLRTVRTPSGGHLKLQIACTNNLNSSTYEFRFRKSLFLSSTFNHNLIFKPHNIYSFLAFKLIF